MSVAFRRDSDEEHLEPKFELPVPVGPNLVTVRGLGLIELRIARLESDLAGAPDEAATASIKRDLRYWHTRRLTAEVAPIPNGEKVEFGVRVTIELNGKQRTFQLVGDDEADPAQGMISFKAPLGQAMLGAHVGDTLAFGNKDDALRILQIEIPPEPSRAPA